MDIKLYKLLISCPSDVKKELRVAEKVIQKWNKTQGDSRRRRVELVNWNTDTIPLQVSRRPQEEVNEQIVDDAQIIVGIFWTRFGTSTGKAGSGTEEEIERSIGNGKKVLLYFSKSKLDPDDLDPEQYSKVKAFQNKYREKRGLFSTFKGIKEFENQFDVHLGKLMNNIIDQEEEKVDLRLGPRKEDPEFDVGSYKSGLYHNEYFGLSMEVPEEWHVRVGNDEKLNDLGLDISFGESKGLKSVLKANMKKSE